MIDFYLYKLMIQIPYVLICLGSVIRTRRRPSWTNILQVIGSGLMVLWIVADSALWDPNFGLWANQQPKHSGWWVPFQTYAISLGLLSFGVGFLIESRNRKADANVMKA